MRAAVKRRPRPSHFREQAPFKTRAREHGTERYTKRAIEKDARRASRKEAKKRKTHETKPYLGHEEKKKREVWKVEVVEFFFSSLQQRLKRTTTAIETSKKKEGSSNLVSLSFSSPILCFSRSLFPQAESFTPLAPHSNLARSRKSRVESATKLSESKNTPPFPPSISMTSRPSSRLASAKAAAATAVAVAAPAVPFEYDDELTEYERERLAKIEENKRIMRELGELMFFFFFPLFIFALSLRKKKTHSFHPSLSPPSPPP